MTSTAPALLAARDVTVTFGAGTLEFDAVQAASVEVAGGQAIGIVGESGSGKTTLARVLVGLQRPTRGAVFLEGNQVFGADGGASFPRSERWKVQMIFQDPYSSLNPRMKAWHGVAEAIQVWRKLPGREARAEAFRLLNSVGISNQQAEHFPRSLSGGQLQRVSVARALAPNPKILIADEPTSSIDQSAQAQLLNLLHELQRERDLTIVFISHDLGLIRYLTSGVYVMQKGQIVEAGDPLRVFEQPEHPYTRLLLASIPGRSREPALPGT